MRQQTLEEWEKKWIIGPIERFDQKYQMFSRPVWDIELRNRLDDWSFFGEGKGRGLGRPHQDGFRHVQGLAHVAPVLPEGYLLVPPVLLPSASV